MKWYVHSSRAEGNNDNDSVTSSPVHLLAERLAEQTYLNRTIPGRELQETSRRTIFEEGVIHTIPVMFIRVNLVPGEMFPLLARSEPAKLLVKYALEHNNCFGVSYELNTNEPSYGTIANIFLHTKELQSEHSLEVKSLGLQRFEILSVDEFPSEDESNPYEPFIYLAQIKIVSDVVLTNSSNKLCSMNRHVASHSNMCRKKKMLQTQWPTWVYNQFEANQLALCVLAKARILYKEVNFSDDPYLFSMQVTRLDVFSDKEVNTMLGLKSTNLRLQHQLHYLNQKQFLQRFICDFPGCGIPICFVSNVYSMSPDGPQGTHCDSWGQIYDVITVTQIDNPNVVILGEPQSECSWFPGYTWVAIACPNCDEIWGWRYVTDSQLSLEPNVFYGLWLRAIKSEASKFISQFIPVI